MKMKNLREDLNNQEELKRDVNNSKKKLLSYQLKSKD